jgi:UDP-N-acetylglucosamine 4,6-dehydratase
MQILITGGTGSFGQAFVRWLVTKPYDEVSRIVVYSRGEHAQEDMAREYNDDRLRFFIGDVRDLTRLELALNGIDTIVHAAALKVVPIAEYNPTECVATNVLGAQNVVKAAIHMGIKRVLTISTDKAVSPINLYGTTKLAAEKIFVAANTLAAGKSLFSVVRYGNVVGSRGSVIPFFRKLAAEGRPLPITHPEMTRFWITMDQAIGLVEKALSIMEGREIFVPKIPSMKIIDLAKAFSDLPTYEIGIRPGEKIHECLITEDEAQHAVNGARAFVIRPNSHLNVLPRGFRYTSDGNTDWLTVEQLKALL